MKRYIPIAFISLGFALFLILDLDRFLSLETLSDRRQDIVIFVKNQYFMSVFIFLAIYIAAVAFSLPGATVLTLTGGFLFGTLAGGFLTVLAATLGATAVFLAARLAFGDILRQKAGDSLKRLRAGFEKNAASYLLFLRLVPLFPFWLVNIAPAFFKVPLRIFLVTTFLGILPGTFVFASIGNGLGTILDAGGTPDLSLITKPEILLPLLGLAVLSLIPVFFRKKQA